MSQTQSMHFRFASETSEMYTIKRMMASHLDAICSSPAADLNMQQWRDYLTSLVAGQRFDLSRSKPGSWCVATDDDDMPKDARVDFIWFPSYIAVATMIQASHKMPDVIAHITGFEESLRKGLIFVANTRFSGHGYDEPIERCEAINLLFSAGVFDFIKEKPEFCPPFLAMLKDVKQELLERIAEKKTVVWDRDFTQDYLQSIDQLATCA